MRINPNEGIEGALENMTEKQASLLDLIKQERDEYNKALDEVAAKKISFENTVYTTSESGVPMSIIALYLNVTRSRVYQIRDSYRNTLLKMGSSQIEQQD